MEYVNVREVLPIVLPDILPGIGISASGIIEDVSHKFVSDIEKSIWNGKTTLTVVKADADISDSINKKHSQNTDMGTNSANFLINGANAIKEGDNRLTDARAPTAHNQDANTINSGTLDGDRLPVISTTKKGGVPATGTPSGKFLKDDNTWAAPAPAAHNLAGSEHNSDTLANLNSKISDADVVALAGQLGGTSASPDVRGIRESGGQLLTMGAVADGQYLKRNGTTIDSGNPGGGGNIGEYSINVQALTSSPTDGQTVYFGMLPKAPTTTANISKIYIRKTCTLKIANIYCYSGTAGSAEAWSLYIRKNNTTDTLIATLSVSASERVFSNTGLNISLIVGDYIEIKGIQPTWGTNPLTTIYGGYLYFE